MNHGRMILSNLFRARKKGFWSDIQTRSPTQQELFAMDIQEKSFLSFKSLKKLARKLVTWPHKRRLFEPEQSAVRRASLFDCSLFDEQFTGQLCSLFILPEHPSLSENKGLFVRLTGDKVKVAPPFIQVWQPDLKLQLKKAHKACSHKAATDKRNRFHTVQQHLR